MPWSCSDKTPKKPGETDLELHISSNIKTYWKQRSSFHGHERCASFSHCQDFKVWTKNTLNSTYSRSNCSVLFKLWIQRTGVFSLVLNSSRCTLKCTPVNELFRNVEIFWNKISRIGLCSGPSQQFCWYQCHYKGSELNSNQTSLYFDH